MSNSKLFGIAAPRAARRSAIAMLVLLGSAHAGFAQKPSAPTIQNGWWAKCVGIADDRARLACFDSSVPSAQAPAARTADAPSVMAAIDTDNSSADIRSAGDDQPMHWRASLGYGLGVAGHAGSFKVLHGKLRSDSGFGTEGGTVMAQAWADDWIADDWSVGLEYVHMANAGRVSLNLPKGISIITDPLVANAHADLKGDTVFANIAYRPDMTGPLETYIGAGLGIGNGSVKSNLTIVNAFLGPRESPSNVSSLYAAPQAFVGVDMPVYDTYYLSLGGKVIFFTGHPVSLDQRYLDYVFSFSIGRKF